MATHTYKPETRVSCTPDELFAWHARKGAFERLSPPWERVHVAARSGTIRDGDTTDLEVKLGAIRIRWRARHQDYVEGKQFCDTQEGGPFSQWRHVHRIHADPTGSRLEDDITYRLPVSLLSDLFAHRVIQTKLSRMFAYRHRTTRDDIALHTRYQETPRKRIGVTGASGLVGKALCSFLTTGGHSVTPIRRSGSASDNSPEWETEGLENLDAVVHLAGESISGRWSQTKKARIEQSRVRGTEHLVGVLRGLHQPPAVLISASAIGIYGDRGDEHLDEHSDRGSGFLSDVCKRWEAVACQAEDSGIRVVNARFGMILSGFGGALPRMLPPFRVGMGGRIGSGQQYTSWIALDDAIGAIHHAIQEPDVQGPMNVVAPEAVTNRSFARTLSGVLFRPMLFPLPGFAARIALGEMADALLLASARCVPSLLASSGYTFRYPELDEALQFQLGRMPIASG